MTNKERKELMKKRNKNRKIKKNSGKEREGKKGTRGK